MIAVAETSASSTVIPWTMNALGKVIRPAGQGLLLFLEHKVWLLQAPPPVQAGPCLHHPPQAGRPTHFSSPHFNPFTLLTTACFNVFHRATPQLPTRTASPVIALQNGLSEDEALQRALELSLAEAKPQVLSSQEEDDLALAQALSASEAEYQQQQAQSRSLKPSNCSLC